MADKKISELTAASEVKNEDNLELSQDTGSGLVSLKATILAIANKMLKGINFSSDLQTTNKTVIGAINEVAQGGGGGGSSTLDGLNDVDIDDSTLADGQALVYDEIEEKWVNGQGGGGTGGHTIIDENGNTMTARSGLQFVGGNVADDSTNNKTIVDVSSAGGIDGVFIDTDNVIVPKTSYNPSSFSYTATEDCVLYIEIPAKGGYSTFLEIDGKEIQGVNLSGSGTTNYLITTVFLKKGQIVTLSSSSFPSVTPDYAVYGIQTGTTHSKFQPVIYSAEEREIGVWEDGKPLYQRTFVYGNDLLVPYNSWVNLGITFDGETIVHTETTASSGSFQGSILIYNDNGTWKGQSPRNGDSSYVKELTIQYTKTTDTAGSGTWTPQGVPAHHYSTDEQIVGTWIDGSTLYEKTIDFGALPNNTTKTVQHNISNLDNIVSIKGIAFNQNGARNLPFVDDAAKSADVLLDTIKSSGVVRIIAHTDLRSLNGYVTLQYTKSS